MEEQVVNRIHAYNASSQILDYFSKSNIEFYITDFNVELVLPEVENLPRKSYLFSRIKDFNEQFRFEDRVVDIVKNRLNLNPTNR